MKMIKQQIKRVNLKLPLYLYQKLMNEKARTYKTLQLLIEEAIKKSYK